MNCSAPLQSQNSLADRYLDLLIRTLTRFDGVDDFEPFKFGAYARFGRKAPARYFVNRAKAAGAEIVRRIPFDARKTKDWFGLARTR